MALASVHDVSGTATKASLTKRLWDSLLHERVQNKQAFANLVGRDKAGEGSIDSATTNAPIVEKTQLGKESGDLITMAMTNAIDANPLTQGWTGVENMIDNENAVTFNYLKVYIAHYANAAGWAGRMSQQRSPFELKSIVMDRLSTALAKQLDDAVPFTIYSGWSPNVVRELDTTIAAQTAHPNRIAGKNKSALTNLSTTDTVDTELLEMVRVWIAANNINPASGDKHIFLIDPKGGKTLRADSKWVDAQINAKSGSDLFANTFGMWANIGVQETNKLSTAKDYSHAGCTHSGSGTGASPNILSYAAADTGGLTSTDVVMNILLGGNAVARAWGMRSYMEKRKEDAYGLYQAWAGGYIYGERRADFVLDSDNSTTVNQSSAVVYSYSPAVVSSL